MGLTENALNGPKQYDNSCSMPNNPSSLHVAYASICSWLGEVRFVDVKESNDAVTLLRVFLHFSPLSEASPSCTSTAAVNPVIQSARSHRSNSASASNPVLP